MGFPLLCWISEAIHLVQLGLMLLGQLCLGWLAGWQVDEIQVIFKIFKIHYRLIFNFTSLHLQS